MDTNDENSIETTDIDLTEPLNESDLDEKRTSILQDAQALVKKFNDTETLDTAKKASTREECFFGMDEEDVLYDAWLVLREQGESLADLQPLTALIEAETIYSEVNMETMYRIGILDEDEEKVLEMDDSDLTAE